LQSATGCHYIYVFDRLRGKNKVVSITDRDSLEEVRKYEYSGRFKELSDKAKHSFLQFFRRKVERFRNK